MLNCAGKIEDGLAAGFIGGINYKPFFVVSVAVQMGFQFLWCILSKIIVSVFSKK